MSEQIGIRYRCVVCAGPVTMGHLSFAAMVNECVTRCLRGHGNIDDDKDYIALVCAECQENPEIGTVLATSAQSDFDNLDFLEAERLGVPYP